MTHVMSLLIALFLVLGCKAPKSDGDQSVKTIENLDGGASGANLCGIEYFAKDSSERKSVEAIMKERSDEWLAAGDLVAPSILLDKTDGKDEKIRVKVQSVLAALPKGILAYLKVLAQGGTQITLEKGVPEQCRNAGSLDETFFEKFSSEAVLGCFQAAENGAPMIYLGSDKSTTVETVLRRDLVRIVGLIYSRYLPSRMNKEGSESFQKAMDELVAAFKKDVKNTARIDKIGKDQLREYVLAESFDSYYCSNTTREHFNTNYATTANFFKKCFKSDLEPKSLSQGSDFSSQCQ